MFDFWSGYTTKLIKGIYKIPPNLPVQYIQSDMIEPCTRTNLLETKSRLPLYDSIGDGKALQIYFKYSNESCPPFIAIACMRMSLTHTIIEFVIAAPIRIVDSFSITYFS